MTQYARGRRKEWEVCKRLREQGYTVVRSAGSHGLWDVTAVRVDQVRLIQVKYSKDRGWWDKNCSALLALPVPPGTTKEAWVFVKGIREPVMHNDLSVMRTWRQVYSET